MRIPDWEVDGTMEKIQRDALHNALQRHNYSVGRAAAQLRIGRSTVYRLMKRYDLGPPDEIEAPVCECTQADLRPPRSSKPSGSKVVFDGTNYVLVKRP